MQPLLLLHECFGTTSQEISEDCKLWLSGWKSSNELCLLTWSGHTGHGLAFDRTYFKVYSFSAKEVLRDGGKAGLSKKLPKVILVSKIWLILSESHITFLAPRKCAHHVRKNSWLESSRYRFKFRFPSLVGEGNPSSVMWESNTSSICTYSCMDLRWTELKNSAQKHWTILFNERTERALDTEPL